MACARKATSHPCDRAPRIVSDLESFYYDDKVASADHGGNPPGVLN